MRPEKGKTLEAYGALRFRSRSAVEALIERLLRHGLLSSRALDNGGVVLELTPSGRAAIRNPGVLDALIVRPHPRVAEVQEPYGDDDLFERLRAWRLEEARTRKVPPYVIFHDAHLRAISAMKPTLPDAMLEINGVGASKVKTYGEQVIAVVLAYLAGAGDAAETS